MLRRFFIFFGIALLVILITAVPIFFIKIYPYLKTPDVDEKALLDELESIKMMVKEFQHRPPEDGEQLGAMLLQLKIQAGDDVKFPDDFCLPEGNDAIALYQLQAKDFAPFHQQLKLILKNGFILWANPTDINQVDTLSTNLSYYRTLVRSMLLDAVINARAGNSSMASETLNDLMVLIGGFYDGGQFIKVLMATFTAGDLLKTLTYLAPILDPADLRVLLTKLDKMPMGTQSMIKAMKIEVAFHESIILLAASGEDPLGMNRGAAGKSRLIPKGLLKRYFRRELLVHLDFVLPRIHQYEEFFNGKTNAYPPAIKDPEDLPDSLMTRMLYIDMDRILEKANKADKSRLSLTKALEEYLKTDAPGTGKKSEITVDENHTLVLDQNGGCVHPPWDKK